MNQIAYQTKPTKELMNWKIGQEKIHTEAENEKRMENTPPPKKKKTKSIRDLWDMIKL